MRNTADPLVDMMMLMNRTPRNQRRSDVSSMGDVQRDGEDAYERHQEAVVEHHFLVVLDGMIEATEEFIADDGLRADDSRIADLAALLHVRELFTTTFQTEDENDLA